MLAYLKLKKDGAGIIATIGSFSRATFNVGNAKLLMEDHFSSDLCLFLNTFRVFENTIPTLCSAVSYGV